MIEIMNYRSGPYGLYYNIIDQIGLFFEAFLFVYLVTALLQSRFQFLKTRTGKIISSLLLAALYSATSILSGYVYIIWFLTIFISCLFYTGLFFHGRFYKKLLLSSVYSCSAVALDGSALFILFEFSDNGMLSVPLFSILFVIRRLLFKVPLAACVRFYIKNDADSVIEMPSSYLFCVTLISCLESLWIMLVPTLNGINYFNCFISIAVLLSMYYLFGATAEIYKENLIHRIQKKEYENFLHSSSESDSRIREIKELRHNIQAHLFCIHSLLEEQSPDEADEYIKSLLNVPINVQEEENYCSNKTINTLLRISKRDTQQNKIPFEASVSLTEKLYIKNADLCVILSNLCSNALAASLTVANPRIEIKIETVKAYLSIIIMNHTDFDVFKENPSLKTTKTHAQYHGIGIQSIKSIVEKYNGVYKIDSDENHFQFNILLENYRDA